MDSAVDGGRFLPASSREIRRNFVSQRRRSIQRERNKFWFLNKKPGTSSAEYNPPDAIQTPESSDGEAEKKDKTVKKVMTGASQISVQKADNSYELETLNTNNPIVQRPPTPINPNQKTHQPPIPTNPNRRRRTYRSPEDGKLRTMKRPAIKQRKRKSQTLDFVPTKKLRKNWLTRSFCTNANLKRWTPNEKNQHSLTRMPCEVMEKIFTYMADKDLYQGRLTCYFFNKAFFKYYKGRAKTKDELKTVLNFSNLGYTFNSIESFNLPYSYNPVEHRVLTTTNFPSLTVLNLNWTHLNTMPANDNLRELTLTNCTFNWERSKTEQAAFSYPNLRKLVIESGSPITEENNLPKLENLVSLTIRTTYFNQSITKNKFKNLRKLELGGSEVMKNIANIRVSRLWDLTIDNINHYPIKRVNQFKYLKKLKIILSERSDSLDAKIIKRISNKYCPYLEVLVFECGISWRNFDFSFLNQHSNLRELQIHLRGVIDPSELTDKNFPSLTTLILNSDEVQIKKLPPHGQLRHIELPPETSLFCFISEQENWPKLLNFGYFGMTLPCELKDAQSALSSTENSCSERDDISLFNIRIKPDGRYLKGAGTYRVVDRNNKYSFIVTKDGMVKDKNRNIVENACGRPLQLKDLEILVVADDGELAIIDVDGFIWSRTGVRYKDCNFQPIRLVMGKPCRLVVVSSTEAYVQ